LSTVNLSVSLQNNPQLLRQVVVLGWPLLLELSLGVAVSFAGTALAGQIGNQHAAAFALTNQVIATLFVLFRILGAGIGVVVAQHLGAHHLQSAQRIARIAVRASFVVGTLLAIAGSVGAPYLFSWFTKDQAILELAIPFLQLIGWGMMLDATIVALFAVLRAHLYARTNLAFTVAMHCLHLITALYLMPNLGLIGYALGLLISRLIVLIGLIYVMQLPLKMDLFKRDSWLQAKRALNDILHIGLPAAAENIGYRIAFIFSIIVLSQWGTQAIATHAYVFQFNMAVLLCGLAIGLTTEILIGRLIGAGQLRSADIMLKQSLALGLALSFSISTVVAIASPWLLKMFTNDPAIIRQASKLLWISIALETGRTFNIVVINALRATGDVRFPVMAGITSMVFVLAGCSWLLGQQLGWGLTGLWVAYAADEWVRGLIMWARWKQFGWLKHARISRLKLRRH
jgi:putative MATE family efflux protein